MRLSELGSAWRALHGDLRGKVRVLVVDDEDVVREILMEIVKLGGWEAEGCATAERGLDRLCEARYDLLLTDKNLPGMTGVELVARARALGIDTPAVVITGYPSGETLAEALRAGAAGYLTKPFDLHHVRARIDSILDERLSSLLYDQMVRDLKALLEAEGGKAQLEPLGRDLLQFKRALLARPAVLVVEATDRDAAAVCTHLNRRGIRAVPASPATARGLVADPASAPLVAEVALDVPNSAALVRHLRAEDPSLEVLVSCRPTRLEEALAVVASGASDLVVHTEGLEALGTRIERLLGRTRRQQLHLNLVATLYRAARGLGNGAAEHLDRLVPAGRRQALERLVAAAAPAPEEVEIDLSDLFAS